jgi:hypothetical protein
MILNFSVVSFKMLKLCFVGMLLHYVKDRRRSDGMNMSQLKFFEET